MFKLMQGLLPLSVPLLVRTHAMQASSTHVHVHGPRIHAHVRLSCKPPHLALGWDTDQPLPILCECHNRGGGTLTLCILNHTGGLQDTRNMPTGSVGRWDY